MKKCKTKEIKYEILYFVCENFCDSIYYGSCSAKAKSYGSGSAEAKSYVSGSATLLAIPVLLLSRF
jgi:hypothetical protein